MEEDDDDSITYTESEEQAGSSHEADDALGLRSMRAKGVALAFFWVLKCHSTQYPNPGGPALLAGARRPKLLLL